MMTRSLNKYLTACLILLSALVVSCDVERYQADPNRSTEAQPQSILPNVLFQSFKNRYPWQPALAVRQITAVSDGQEWQNYDFSFGNWDEYNILRNVQKIMETAANKPQQAAYSAVGKILRAHHFFFLTRLYGDVPYSEALHGEDQAVAGRFTPRYDSQKAVMIGILAELEEANQILKDQTLELNGDIVYGGDILKWRKLANSYKLRILIMLSNRTSDGDLRVVESFQQIVANPQEYPLFSSPDDEVRIAYLNSDDVRYPLYDHLDTRNKRFLGKTLCDLMKQLQDPRLFYYAQPTKNATLSGLSVTDVNAYAGIDASQTVEQVSREAETGDFSRLHTDHYTASPTGKPSLGFSYAELMLALAEASAREWITTDAEYSYTQAVNAALAFYDIPNTDIESYLSGEAGYTPSRALEQIYEQRYLLFYHQGDLEPFFHYHRTGYPAIICGTGQHTSIVPYRMLYPKDEVTVNEANLQAALDAQGFEADKTTCKPWIY